MSSGLNLNMNARTLALVLCGAAIVIGAAGWLLVVGPKRSHASKLATTVQAKQSQVASLQREQSPGRGGLSGASSKDLTTALPDIPDMPQVIDQLNALALRAGVSLDTVTPAATTAGTGYEAVPINVVVDGHYFGVEKFLHLVRLQVAMNKSKLHAHGRLFAVESVQLQQTEPAPMVTATLGLQTFYYSAAAAPPVPAPTSTDSSVATAAS
jgi:Tfp pilus assembly protein PilO